MNIRPNLAEFVRLSRRGNVIPVYGELLADLETPVSAFLKLDDKRFSYLLESVEGEEKVARFSFLGSWPRLLFTSAGRHIEISEFRERGSPTVTRFETRQDPLAEIQRLMQRFRFVPVAGLPRFSGGLVGYLGYNVVQFLERLPAHQVDDLRVPDIMLLLTDTLVIFDHAQHKLLLVVNAHTQGGSPAAIYRHAVRQIETLAVRLHQPITRRRARRARVVQPPVSRSAMR
jgi:anthranilate synthase component 1